MTQAKTMRRVTVFDRRWDQQARKYDLIPVNHGVFHCWGYDVEEGESGVASYSVAIVELEDGTVITPMAQLIKFHSEPT